MCVAGIGAHKSVLSLSRRDLWTGFERICIGTSDRYRYGRDERGTSYNEQQQVREGREHVGLETGVTPRCNSGEPQECLSCSRQTSMTPSSFDCICGPVSDAAFGPTAPPFNSEMTPSRFLNKAAISLAESIASRMCSITQGLEKLIFVHDTTFRRSLKTAFISM